jgi:predicted AAA+ superfamily ATPase
MLLLEKSGDLYYTFFMIRKAKCYFNTSGPNISDKHYTLKREYLIPKGVQLVTDDRYFTIWAPRQTGKTTYFISLAKKLKTLGYQVLQTNLENFKKD